MRISSFALVLVLASSCGKGGGTDGGGSIETGGNPDMAPGGATCLPGCLSSKLSQCAAPMDADESNKCTMENFVMPPLVESRLCYSNGVKIVVDQMVQEGAPYEVTNTVTKNGAACWTTKTTYDKASNMLTTIFKSPDGTLFATIIQDSMMAQKETVICGGESYVVDLSSAACKGSGPSCKLGTCAK